MGFDDGGLHIPETHEEPRLSVKYISLAKLIPARSPSGPLLRTPLWCFNLTFYSQMCACRCVQMFKSGIPPSPYFL